MSLPANYESMTYTERARWHAKEARRYADEARRYATRATIAACVGVVLAVAVIAWLLLGAVT